VYVTWQLAVPGVPVPERVHVLELNAPVEFVVKLTEPTGVILIPGEVSLAVAVHA